MINQSILLGILIFIGIISNTLFQIYLPGHPILSTIVPCLCIAGYVIINKLKGCIGSTLIQVADNTYFMGFIFTLWGLVFVLFSLEKNSFQIESILANAGVAFSTTLLASLLRLIMIQSAITVDEAGSIAEQSLLHATHKYTSALISSAEKVERHHNDQLQKLNSMFETNVDVMRNNITTLNDSFLASARAFKETALSTAYRLRETLENFAIPEDILVRRLNPAINKLEISLLHINNALHAYAEDTSKSAGNMRLLVKASEQYANDIAKLCDEMSNTAQHVHADSAQLGEIMKGVNNILISLHKMNSTLVEPDQNKSNKLFG